MTKKKIFIIVAILLLILLTVGLSWYILYGGKDTGETPVDNETPAKTETINKDIVVYIDTQQTLTDFRKLLRAAGVSDTLKDPNTKYIILAPNDKAFDKLPSGYYDSLISGDKATSAQDIAKYHVISVTTDQITKGQKLKTLQGQEIIVGMNGQRFSFTSAKGDTATTQVGPIKVTNGSIYIIDTVMLPQ
jgi:uncharacterized surface protein with fasciclin (FAS1) repeats